MTEDRIEITRRHVLASTGAIGLAGAKAGLGTSAFFKDEESFEGNTIAAGNLDLTVDWEEHYSYPQLYGFEDPTAGLDNPIHRSEPTEDGYVGLPDPENPMIWVHEDDLAAYMANTAIEAFPDPNDDGQQEISGDFDGEEFVYEPCDHGANLPEHLDPDGLRTANESTRGPEGEPAPLVNLQDVKPGDFGEFTLSFHLCGNPGYVWLRADNVSESENGLTDPESGIDNSGDVPELAEKIQTAWWYDTNGNNVVDESVGAVDVMLLVDTSGSLSGSEVQSLQADANNLASDLEATGDARVGGLTFGDGSIDDFVGLSDSPVQFSGLSPGGNTPMAPALEIAQAELDANARTGADTFVVLFTDGGPNYANTSYSAGGHTVSGYTGGTSGDSAVSNSELCETGQIADEIRADHRILTVGMDDDRNPTGNSSPEDCNRNAIASLSQYLRDYIAGSQADYFQAENSAAVGSILDAIIEAIAMSEQVFHRGTLSDDIAALSSGAGIPLDSDLASDFDELADSPAADARQCFDPGVTNYVGFAWWLPIEVGNEIQSDSVGFDLGFYAEQCRNNDGSGTA